MPGTRLIVGQLPFAEFAALMGAAAPSASNVFATMADVAAAVISANVLTPKVLVFADSPYTVVSTDEWLLCNCTGGVIVVNLPLAATLSGRVLHINKTDATANAVTITPQVGNAVQNAATLPLPLQGSAVMLGANGAADWWIVA